MHMQMHQTGACICKYMHARAGTCICTCISQKSLHGFLAWYLHGICMVLHGFSWYLHGICMGAACIFKSHEITTNRLWTGRVTPVPDLILSVTPDHSKGRQLQLQPCPFRRQARLRTSITVGAELMHIGSFWVTLPHWRLTRQQGQWWGCNWPGS